MGRLDGKVAVITAATSGMALATAKLFVEEGAYVFITGRRQKQLDDAEGDRQERHRRPERRRESRRPGPPLRLVKREKGRIDVLFASAGYGEYAPIGEVTEEHFDKTFDLNVRGTLFTVQKALPLVVDGGSIIMNGSIASVKGFPAFGVYNASKAAIRSFARTWTVDLKARKIRVNVLSPGTVDTGIFDGLPNDAKETFVAMIPRGTIGRPEEIATAALFLASSDSSFVTGIELFVDGGVAQI
jgi:NAD(P)-dependent dehydrogenase (short-subunit alcohol dehydrogenase family)